MKFGIAILIRLAWAVMDQERATADAGTLRFDETEHRVRGDRRFDSVTAFFQYLDGGIDSMGVGCRYDRPSVPWSPGLPEKNDRNPIPALQDRLAVCWPLLLIPSERALPEAGQPPW